MIQVHYSPCEYVMIAESFEISHKELYEEFRSVSRNAMLGERVSIQGLENLIRENSEIEQDFLQFMTNIYMRCLEIYGDDDQ
ncbi:MAG: hypothetical protein ACLFTR_03395 [Candidatus Woesearchaeota archaeon]